MNTWLTYLSGFNENGYVTVLDEFSDEKAGIYVNSAGQGVVYADVKSFRMKNPDSPDTDIWYACPEGPEAAAYIRGTAQLQNGSAVITIPDHFRAVASPDGMTVTLTPLSASSNGLAVTKKGLDECVVQELANGTGNYEFDYYIMAVRSGHEDFRVIRSASEVTRPTRDVIKSASKIKAQ
jgi:hypothetical protein